MQLPHSTPYGLLVNPHPLLSVGLIVLCGYVGGKLANAVKAPRVTGYLLAGILLGPSLSGVLPESLVQHDLAVITDIALGFIAFSIGGALDLRQIKRLGKPIAWITFTQAAAAFAFTTLVVSVLFPLVVHRQAYATADWGHFFPMALVVGAMSAATAPAASLAIVHECRAKGPLTTVLLGVVALDDAVTIIFYSVAIAVARTLMAKQPLSWASTLLMPSASILIALALGGAVGVGLRFLIRFVPRREGMLAVATGCVFLISGLALGLGASPLLANMTLGVVVINFVRHAHDLFEALEALEETLFGMFFTLAGAHLNLAVIPVAGALALLIVAGRFSGKIIGSVLGAKISHAPDVVKKYLGFALLPKAGVTVGLVLVAESLFATEPVAEMMVNAVLASVLLNEVVAPVLVRYALIKAGEAGKARETHRLVAPHRASDG